MNIVSVILPIKLLEPLIYSAANDILAGDIVLVEVRKKKLIGIVLENYLENNNNYQIKPILEKYYNIKNVLNFILFIANYNLIELHILVKTVLFTPIQKRTSHINSLIKKITLNNEQQEIIDDVINNKNISLLEGVTGSGKTELAIEMARIILNQQKQVLILIPEILLADQIIQRLHQGLSDDVVLQWHSSLKKTERINTWLDAINGIPKVFIGTRSSIFLPLTNLGIIIVDEEHDQSFKQDNVPVYNAVEMIIGKAKIENIPIVLMSATPSFNTLYNIKQNNYKHYLLTNKFFNTKKPDIEIIDMWSSKNNIFHHKTIQTIEEFLPKSQVLIFLNRKGYGTDLLCNKCKIKLKCLYCDVKLVYYKKSNLMICHHCGYKHILYCTLCKSDNIILNGWGIEKIEEEIKNLFPKQNIIMITGDNKNRATLKNIEKANIIIGTQVLAKGLHFTNMNLCVIVDLDPYHNSLDLYSNENNYQIIQQVIGRIGRETHGKVLIQTFHIKDEIINIMINNEREKFLALETHGRLLAKMPPYYKIAAIIITSLDRDKLHLWIKKNILLLPASTRELMILGPLGMAKLANRYRLQILIKSVDINNIRNLIKEWLYQINITSYITIKIDFDPNSLN
jgi:primosomal protein N' (replication factor Y)